MMIMMTIETAAQMAPEAEDDWALSEFGEAQLGDKRRTTRLIELARELGARPTASLPCAFSHEAALKGAYRFFENPHISAAAILQSHVQSTYRRAACVPLVLAPQDTTLVDWSQFSKTEGLGPLSHAHTRGLMVHSTLGVTPDGVPLGLLAQERWARDALTFAALPKAKERPLPEKESARWGRSLQEVNAARRACPNTRFVSIGDREADLFDLWHEPRERGVELLVRAAQNRLTCQDGQTQRLWAAMQEAEVVAHCEVALPARSAAPGRRAQAARTAKVEVRWRALQLQVPRHRRRQKDAQGQPLQEAPVWAIWVKEVTPEVTPPEGVTPEVTLLEWLLLSSFGIQNAAEAVERIEWYRGRWSIEVWHKVLKSGTAIEERRGGYAQNLERCLCVCSVLAWRLFYATMLCRVVPDVPCNVLLEEDEWRALFCRVRQTPQPPPDPPPLHEAVRAIAQLGGFIARKPGAQPGVTVLWRGFHQLQEITAMYRIFKPLL